MLLGRLLPPQHESMPANLVVLSTFLPPDAERVYADALVERGMRKQDIQVVTMRAGWQDTLKRAAPALIVAFGDDAARALVPDAPSVYEARGFVFDSSFGPVLFTVDPGMAARSWKPWRTLFSTDLYKAKTTLAAIKRDGYLRRPERETHIVATERDAGNAVDAIRRSGRCASDIEIYDPERLQCVGFADRSNRAFVFTPAQLGAAGDLLRDPNVAKTFHNGAFDLHFLKYRAGVIVANFNDDSILAWHSLMPELAGAEDTSGSNGKRRRNKATRKSLAFLASLFTLDRAWKNYDTDDDGMYLLNGQDCCITFDCMENHLRPMLKEMGTEAIYRHELGLVWPVVDMLARGMNVDDALRKERIIALEESVAEDTERLNALALPVLEARWEEIGERERSLFEQQEGVCPCCRHASKKQQACWGCAGFRKAPGKRELAASGKTLSVCKVCGGAERKRWLHFNPGSTQQKIVLLYDLLKLPQRTLDGKLTTNEEALKSLLGAVT